MAPSEPPSEPPLHQQPSPISPPLEVELQISASPYGFSATSASHSPYSGEDHLPLLPAPPPSFPLPPQPAGASLGSAVFNLTTTIVGAGIMALPATMKVLGLPLGVLAIALMGLVSEASIEILVVFSTQKAAWTYGETVQGACGWAGRRLAEICIMVNNAGILVVYLIIIGEVLSGSVSGGHQGLLQEWAGGAGGWWSDRKLVIFLSLVMTLAPLCFLKRIDSLRFSSAVSVLLAILFVFLSSAIAVVKLALGRLTHPRLLPNSAALLDLLVVLPIMTNAFICHFNVQPIYSELRHRCPSTMIKVARISTLLCVIVYSLTAVSCYLLFGDSTASDVLTNFDQDLGLRFSTLLNDVIRVGYVIHLMFVFPVIHFSLRQTVVSFFFPVASESNSRFVYLTLLLLTLIYLSSAVIPNIWVAFQFTGATTGLTLGFIFPALVGLRCWRASDIESRKRSLILVGCWTMLAMAVTVSFVGIAGNVISLTTSLHS